MGITAQRAPVADLADAWDAFVDTSPQGTLFCRSWWLTAAAPGAEVLVLRRGGRIEAGLPLIPTGPRRFGRAILSPTNGPLLAPPQSDRYVTRLSTELDLLGELAAALPPFEQLELDWHPSLTHWLPFRWAGFQQTTRYTYVLPDLHDLQAVFAETRSNIRTDVRKAQRQGVRVVETHDLDRFLRLSRLTFERQGLGWPLGSLTVRRLLETARSRGAAEVLIATGPDGVDHAGAVLAFDARMTWYLVGGGDPDLRNSGATSLLLWTAIERAAARGTGFDFEGSQIQAIERFFRAFGAHALPCLRVYADRRPPARKAADELERLGRGAVRRLRDALRPAK